MGNEPLIKIKATTAAEICERLNLKPEAKPLLRDGMTPADFIEALLGKKQYLCGIEFLAHALPPREAVWWGCLCLQHACGDTLSTQEKAACRTAVRWVFEPVEELLPVARTRAEAAGAASPAGALAAAVGQTSGNTAPPKAPPVPPPPFAPAKAVANAVKMASAKAEPVKIPETQRLFVELGVGIAEGRFM